MRICLLFVLLNSLLIVQPETSYAQQDRVNRHVLLIGGLGGSPDHTKKFQNYLFDTRKAFIDQFQVPASQITVLGEASIISEGFVDDLSNAENIRAAFAAMRNKVGESDHVFVILFGHGGYDNGEARLNIPRRDLSQHDFASLVNDLPAGRIVIINTSSASAPYIDAISGPNKIVITATRTGTQKNETSFPRFMIEALTSPSADRDKDSRVSVAEVFTFAAEKTGQMFADNANIPTENALLDDNGDKVGSRLEELAEGKDGHLAGITFLSDGPALASLAENAVGNSPWAREKDQIEVEIAGLKSQKDDLSTDEYYDRLEELFIRLARGNATVEATH